MDRRAGFVGDGFNGLIGGLGLLVMAPMDFLNGLIIGFDGFTNRFWPWVWG